MGVSRLSRGALVGFFGLLFLFFIFRPRAAPAAGHRTSDDEDRLIVDTPGEILMQISRIGNASLYGPRDVQSILTAATVAQLHFGEAVYLTARPLVSHTLGTASCMLHLKASAAEVSFASIHTYWYAATWLSGLDDSALCQHRIMLASFIGREAESLLWRYSHFFLHGQDPDLLQPLLQGVPEHQLSAMDRKLLRFIFCDELEVVRRLDRVWFNADTKSSASDLSRRLDILTKLAQYAGIQAGYWPGLLQRKTVEMMQILQNQSHLVYVYKDLWKSSVPSLAHWNIPSRMSAMLQKQKHNPVNFFADYLKHTRDVDSFCPPPPTDKAPSSLHDLEGKVRRLVENAVEKGHIWKDLISNNH